MYAFEIIDRAEAVMCAKRFHRRIRSSAKQVLQDKENSKDNWKPRLGNKSSIHFEHAFQYPHASSDWLLLGEVYEFIEANANLSYKYMVRFITKKFGVEAKRCRNMVDWCNTNGNPLDNTEWKEWRHSYE